MKRFLSFNDDTILFLQTTNSFSSNFKSCLTIFSPVSGLKINLQKSTIYNVGWDYLLASTLATELSCQVSNLSLKYLSLPIARRIINCANWNHVVGAF